MLTFNFAEIQSPMLFQKQSTNLHSKKKKNASTFQIVVNKKSLIHYRSNKLLFRLAKSSVEVGHLAVKSRRKKFKSGYIGSLNQKQKFVIIIVVSVLENDGAKQQCQLISMSYATIPYKKNLFIQIYNYLKTNSFKFIII